MKKIYLLLLALTAVIMVSCTTEISEKRIASIEVTVRNEAGNPVEILLPDTEYTVDFQATDSGGKVYKSPDYRDFSLFQLHNMELSQQKRRSVLIRTKHENFHPPGEAAFGFRAAVKDNPFPARFYGYQLDWYGHYSMDFSGGDGKDGKNGDDGSDASGSSEDNVKGDDGEDGRDGTDGGDGEGLKLLLMHYNHGGEERLLLYEPDKDQLYISELKAITIDTSGGNGGRGGSGGNGGEGKNCVDEVSGEVIKGGVPGDAGDGGRGGQGGSGGDITLLAKDEYLFDYVQPIYNGGEGGSGGAPGRTLSAGGTPRRWGKQGRSGDDGDDGVLKYDTISEFELRSFFNMISHEGFDPSKVIY